jgi:signal transduction histidine kinase
MSARLWAWRAALSESLPWLIAQAATDALFILFAWLAYPESFALLVGLMLLVSAALMLAVMGYRAGRLRRLPQALQDFLLDPGSAQEQALVRMLPIAPALIVTELGHGLRQLRTRLNAANTDLDEYKASIEAWVHEMKTPLALMLLVMGNRKDHMSPLVLQRFSHAHARLSEHVETILYYARLRAAHKDYVFESLDLLTQLREALEDAQASLDEAGVSVELVGRQDARLMVTSDRKGLAFMLRQILANAVKHAKGIRIEACRACRESGGGVKLSISDDGPGVSPSDLPFIFERGFTGMAADKASTGIGLYLVARMAHDLGIGIEAASPPASASPPATSGLEITLTFPE